MEVILIKAVQLILSLSILVILHEFGHFAFARLFKTRVEKFYLFFDPWFSLFKFKKGHTEYGVGWIPLGGYVKIAGMIDESMDKEAMKEAPKSWEFRSKKSYQRLLIMLGGVLMNFILAFVIYIGVLYAWGTSYLPTANVKDGIAVTEVGQQIGLQNGDKILSVDQKQIENFYNIIPTVVLDKASTIEVLRDGKQVSIPVTDDDLALLIKNANVLSPRIPLKYMQVDKIQKDSPASVAGLKKGDQIVGADNQTFTFYDELISYLKSNKLKTISLHLIRNNNPVDIKATISSTGTLGFYPTQTPGYADYLKFKTIRYSFGESIPAGIERGITTLKNYLKQFKLIFSPKTKAYESLGGFIAIGKIFPGTWDWFSFWNMTAFLSIILGVMNLLPIPALDGGHVLFLIFEMISGRKPGEKFLEYAQITGMVILLGLVLYANANDIIKLFS